MDQPATPALNAFFEAYCRRRPVNASFLGIHDHDDLLPDFSEAGIADTVDEMATLRSRLNGNSVDEQLARSFLTIQSREYVSDHFYRSNPALYTGEAIFGILTSPQRLTAVPRLLAQARANVRTAPMEWTRRAIQECRAALKILERIPESEDARKAFQEFESHLAHEVLQHPCDQYGCGFDFFDLLMKEGHRMRQSTDEFLRFAEDEFDKHRHAQSPPDHPTIHDLNQHQACWDECRGIVENRQLLTWPEFPLMFTRPPDLIRDAAQDLYYLSYRSPAAFNSSLPHRCEVTPCGPITLKLNHVVHHAGPGHHVQNYYAYRSPSLIGKIAAVDCASRIALFCGGTMAEGWACYATDLMEEFDFLNAEERRHQEHTRLRMAARGIVDIKLHCLQMTFAEAVDFYRTQVGMSEVAATKEAVRNSMFPGTAMMYLLGTSTIHRLRQELGSRMTLREFHDRFLSYGSIPVAMIADLMTASSATLETQMGVE